MRSTQVKDQVKTRRLKRLIRRNRFLPAVPFCLFLWIVASLPGSDLRRIQTSPESALFRFILSDPCMHFLTFGLLTLLLCVGFFGQSGGSIRLLRVGAFATGYGLLIEAYQQILPERAFGLDDALWNVVGVLFSLALIWWRLSRRGGSAPPHPPGSCPRRASAREASPPSAARSRRST